MLERAATLTDTRAPIRTQALGWLAGRRTLVVWWMGSRGIVLVAALWLHVLRVPRGYFGEAVFAHPFGALEAWDGLWYRQVAERGYLLIPGHQSDPAFFPFYSVLLKLVGATGLPLGVAGLLLSNAFFLGALFAFDAFGRRIVGSSLARRATLLLAVFPMGYVCSMVYPASLALLAFALVGLFSVEGRWLSCAAAAAVAALACPEGVLLFLPIAGCLATRWRYIGPQTRGRGIAAVLAAPAAAISFPVYLGWTLRNPLAWSDAQQAWGRSFRVDGAWHSLAGVGTHLGRSPWAARDIGLCIFTLLLLSLARRVGAPLGWILLGAMLVLLPLGSGSFESDARFGLLALPAYWGLAALTSRRWTFRLIAVFSAALLAAAVVTLPLISP